MAAVQAGSRAAGCRLEQASVDRSEAYREKQKRLANASLVNPFRDLNVTVYIHDGRRTLPERCSTDVLRPIKKENLPHPLAQAKIYFGNSRTNFREWRGMCGKWMYLKRKKFVDVVRKEMRSLGMRKVEFALLVQMLKKNENDERILVDNYFKNETKVFQNSNENEITEKLMEFVNEINTKIEIYDLKKMKRLT